MKLNQSLEILKKNICVRFTGFHLLVGALLVVNVLFFMMGSIARQTIAQQRQIQSLREAMASQAQHVKTLTKENEQVAQVLEKQSHVLSQKLRQIQKQNDEVRKIVGLKPKKVFSQPVRIKSSRGVSLSRLRSKYIRLQTEVRSTQKELSTLKTAARKYRVNQERERLLAEIASTPSIWPTNGEVTSGFGWRSYPYGEFHRGLDIVNDYGAPIVATADGIVTMSEYYGGYGNTVQIDHNNGWSSLYGHCSRLVVALGQRVKKGEVIAYIGSTGYSTGPHVHYEVCRYGQNIDPDSTLDIQRKKLELLARLR